MASELTKAVGFFSIFLLGYSPLSYSHEFWLDPVDTSVDLGNAVTVDVRNGQDFSGTSFPYDAAKYKSIKITSNISTVAYSGRLGDYPAIQHNTDTIGLHSVSLDTTENFVVYDSWNDFVEFLAYHGLDQLAQQHVLRGLSKSDIKERYFRSAKTLFQVNSKNKKNPPGYDMKDQAALAPVGSMFEMSPLNNPYAAGTELRIQLLFTGAPLPARQVEMFWRGSSLLRLTTITDENGVATFKYLGDGDYMLNAVHVVEPQQQGVDWVSYWASITFEL